MVESSINISETQAEILQSLSNFLTVSDIAKHRKTTRQAVYKVIIRLIGKGLLKRVGGVLGLTQNGKKGLHSLMGLTNKLRQHNFGVKIEILESRRNWDRKRNIIMRMPYFNKRVKLKNNFYDLLSFGKVGIKSTTKSIIFNLPTLFGSVDEAVIQAMDILFSTIPKVESRFNIKLVKDQKMNMTIISQEYAKLNDALARIYKEKDKKLYIVDERGELRFIADYSFALSEFETVHPSKAGDDMNAVNPFLLDLARNPTTLSKIKEEMEREMSEVANLIKKTSGNQMTLSQTLEQMSNNIIRITKEIVELKK